MKPLSAFPALTLKGRGLALKVHFFLFFFSMCKLEKIKQIWFDFLFSKMTRVGRKMSNAAHVSWQPLVP